MFGKLVENATSSLGKSFTVVGLLPALVLLLGIAATLRGPSSVPAVLGLLDKGIDAAATAWFILALFAIGVVFLVLRGWMAHVHEELPGRIFAPLRNWLIKRALAKRSDGERELENLQCAYTALNWFAEPRGDIGYVPSVIGDLDLEDVRTAWQKAVARLEQTAAAHPGGPPSVSAAEADDIKCGVFHLYVYCGRNPGNEFATSALNEWRKFLEKNRSPASATLCLVRDICHRKIAALVLRLDKLPVPTWIKPTDFGNRVSAFADYADKRYGIDTLVLWERLWWVLPAGHQKEIAESRVLVEMLTALSSCLWLLAGFSALSLLAGWVPMLEHYPGLRIAPSAPELVAFSVSFALAAYVFYRMSVTALEGLVQKIRPLVDLYRLRLLKALGFAAATVKEERAIFFALGHFMMQSVPLADNQKIVMDLKSASKDEGDDGDRDGSG